MTGLLLCAMSLSSCAAAMVMQTTTLHGAPVGAHQRVARHVLVAKMGVDLATPPAVIAAAPAPAPPPPPPPAAHMAAPLLRDALRSADGRIRTGVGTYSDCYGNAAVPRDRAAIDTCARDRIYFVGHNPGVFSGLFDEPIGALIDWYDDSGTVHHFTVVARREGARVSLPLPLVGGAVAQFQTCVDLAGTEDFVLDATES